MRSGSTWTACPTSRWPASSAATRRRSTTRSSASSGRSSRIRRRARCSRSYHAADLVVGGEADSAPLTVARRVDPQSTLTANRQVLDRDQVPAQGLWAVDGEEIDVAEIVSL